MLKKLQIYIFFIPLTSILSKNENDYENVKGFSFMGYAVV
jgi:hypothetical protein